MELVINTDNSYSGYHDFFIIAPYSNQQTQMVDIGFTSRWQEEKKEMTSKVGSLLDAGASGTKSAQLVVF